MADGGDLLTVETKFTRTFLKGNCAFCCIEAMKFDNAVEDKTIESIEV